VSVLADNLDAEEAAQARADRRLLTWLRREVNRDLRYWRHDYDCEIPADRREQLVADCKAKLELIRWAENWQGVRDPDRDVPGRPDVRATLLSDLRFVMAAIRRVAAGYKGRDGWRGEWDLR